MWKMPKVAITGAGYAAHYYVEAFKELGYPIVGITNRTEDKGLLLAKEANTRFYASYKDLVRDSHAEMICIATATANHLQEIQKAAEGGVKWIFCEKPAGTSITETQRISDICAAHGVLLGIGYKMRFESIFKQAKSMVESGTIGKLVSMTINFYQPIPHSPWYLDDGFIRETLAHTIDLSNWFAASAPKWVMCNAESHAGGKKEDRVSLIVKYDSGITTNLSGGWIADYPYIPGRQNICFQLVGTGGYIFGVRPNKLVLCNEQGPQTIEIESINAINAELRDFVAKITNGDQPSVGIADAIRAQKIIDAAVRSANSEGASKSCN